MMHVKKPIPFGRPVYFEAVVLETDYSEDGGCCQFGRVGTPAGHVIGISTLNITLFEVGDRIRIRAEKIMSQDDLGSFNIPNNGVDGWIKTNEARVEAL